MDFNTLKDVNVAKNWLKGIGLDIIGAAKSIKNASFEKFKGGFNEYFVEYLKTSYAKFDGRISRRQYWMFALYSIIISIIFQILIAILPIFAILGLLYSLALLVPSIGLLIRRLHDINLPGWWLFIAVVPFVGAIALLLLLCTPGDAKANNYGTEK